MSLTTSAVGAAKRTVAVIGLGQVGSRIARTLLNEKLAHVVVVSRGPSAENDAFLKEFASKGARVAYCDGSYDNVAAMTAALTGADVAIVCLRFNVEFARTTEPRILEAAKAAGVRRFVPCEFGVNSFWIERGSAMMFDAKRTFGELVEASGLEYTFFFAGGFFHYHLPQFGTFGNRTLTTFGDVDKPAFQNDLDDLCTLMARLLVDDRARNKRVQFDNRALSQRQMIAILQASFPDREFTINHVSSEEITRLKDDASATGISAAGGHEPDNERHSINHAVWVNPRLAFAPYGDDGGVTVSIRTLFPDYVFATVESRLADPHFVFGKLDPDEIAPRKVAP